MWLGRQDSNLGSRDQSPLPYRLATPQSSGDLRPRPALDERVRYGDPFLKKGDAHRALGAVDDAAAAYERFTNINGSSLEGFVKLARARSKKGDSPGAKAALTEARRTFQHLPGFQRKKQWGWYLAAYALAPFA